LVQTENAKKRERGERKRGKKETKSTYKKETKRGVRGRERERGETLSYLLYPIMLSHSLICGASVWLNWLIPFSIDLACE